MLQAVADADHFEDEDEEDDDDGTNHNQAKSTAGEPTSRSQEAGMLTR